MFPRITDKSHHVRGSVEEGSGWTLAGAAAGVAVLPILGRTSVSWNLASLPFDER